LHHSTICRVPCAHGIWIAHHRAILPDLAYLSTPHHLQALLPTLPLALVDVQGLLRIGSVHMIYAIEVFRLELFLTRYTLPSFSLRRLSFLLLPLLAKPALPLFPPAVDVFLHRRVTRRGAHLREDREAATQRRLRLHVLQVLDGLEGNKWMSHAIFFWMTRCTYVLHTVSPPSLPSVFFPASASSADSRRRRAAPPRRVLFSRGQAACG